MGVFGPGPSIIDAGFAAAEGIDRIREYVERDDPDTLTDQELQQWAEDNGFNYRKEDGVTYLTPQTEEAEQALDQSSYDSSEGFPIKRRMLEPGPDTPALESNNDNKGESTMTDDQISTAYDGSHDSDGALNGGHDYQNLEVDLRQIGGKHYRENEGLYANIDDPKREDEIIQATGAALLLEDALENDKVDQQLEQLEQLERYMSDQGLREEFKQYKEGLADGALPDKAASKVVGLLDEFEEYAEETESLTTLNNAASQEEAQHMLNYAESLREITDRASDIDMDDFNAPERLADNLRELGRKRSRLSDIESDIEDDLDNM
jgi:hypothetical protein